MVRELCKIYAAVDPVHEPIPIRPVVHYVMGGVDVDIDGNANGLAGLFAAGETACVSMNGANRLGSNSLTECLVFGARSGISAVNFAKGASAGDDATLAQVGDAEQARIEALRGKRGGGETLAGIRGSMQQAMEAGFSVYREGAPMQQGVRDIAEIQNRYRDLALEDSSKVFNTEIIAALELENMLDCAEAVSSSAASRNESRGAHTRRDAPTRDDVNFLYHTLCHFDPAGLPRLDKKDVTLGRWEPEERKY